MFVNEVYAASGEAAAQHSSAYAIVMNLVPFILIFAVFYLILILPQRRKQKALKQMLANIKHGDKVILSSGIIAKIVRVKDDERVIVKTSEATELEVVRNAIVNVIPE
ncbi:preprotein translocase subunit YajC [Rickettsiales bacterium LUAb2]